jgi:hypothetical protein
MKNAKCEMVVRRIKIWKRRTFPFEPIEPFEPSEPIHQRFLTSFAPWNAHLTLERTDFLDQYGQTIFSHRSPDGVLPYPRHGARAGHSGRHGVFFIWRERQRKGASLHGEDGERDRVLLEVDDFVCGDAACGEGDPLYRYTDRRVHSAFCTG